jgi:hypothetical protein
MFFHASGHDLQFKVKRKHRKEFFKASLIISTIYSKTCLRQPPLRPQKSGRCTKVVAQ